MTEAKQQRIVRARMKLRERFEAEMAGTPARSDGAPMGSGPANRHGMPKLPPGQVVAKGWPVLDLGLKPMVEREDWRLEIVGACDHPMTIDWNGLMSLEQVDDVSDFHCVTTWSKMDMEWRGVRFADLMALVGVRDDAEHVFVHGYDGYTTNLPLVEAMKPDVLMAHTVYGEDLSIEHGGPVRMITPQLYAWKGAKWIKKIELLTEDRKGFWELRGYSNTAHPWRNDRYS